MITTGGAEKRRLILRRIPAIGGDLKTAAHPRDVEHEKWQFSKGGSVIVAKVHDLFRGFADTDLERNA